MKILGIDPGLRKTGFGVIEQHGSKLLYVASGVIKTGTLARPATSADTALDDLPASDTSNELASRLRTILTGVGDVIDRFGADCAAIEKVFVNVNPQSTLLLGQARGAAICGIVLRDLPVQEYTALQIKKSVTGHGKAQKEQVQEMVRRFLDLPGLPGPDAADALAVAICHAHSHQALTQLRHADPRAVSLGKNGMRMRGGRLIG